MVSIHRLWGCMCSVYSTAWWLTLLLMALALGLAGVSRVNAKSGSLLTSSEPNERAFKPVADTYVNAEYPFRNYGRSKKLRTDATPHLYSLIKFDLRAVDGPLERAQLAIYAHTGSTLGIRVHEVSDTGWEEAIVTYESAPALGDVVSASGRFSRDSWVIVDVTSLVEARNVESLAITTTSNTSIRLSSRENEAFIPYLIVETSSGFDPDPTPTAMPPLPPITDTQVFVSKADAYVAEISPTQNYGSSKNLRTDGSPDLNSYLRFNVRGLHGRVTRAELRIYARSGSSIGYRIHDIGAGSWEEMTISYSTAPTVDNLIGASGRFSKNTWTRVDVTSIVDGDGVHEFVMTTASDTAIRYASRESDLNAPQLVIETAQ